MENIIILYFYILYGFNNNFIILSNILIYDNITNFIYIKIYTFHKLFLSLILQIYVH